MGAVNPWTTPIGWTLLTIGQILAVLDLDSGLAGLPAAGRPQDLGGGDAAQRPQRGRPLRPAPVVRRLRQVRAEGDHHPVGSGQDGLPAGPLDQLHPCLRRMGGDPGRAGLGDLQHQRRRALPVRRQLAGRLRHHHGRLGVQLEVPLPRRAALGGADGLLRGLHRLRDRHGRAAHRLAASSRPSSPIRRAGSGTGTSWAAAPC